VLQQLAAQGAGTITLGVGRATAAEELNQPRFRNRAARLGQVILNLVVNVAHTSYAPRRDCPAEWSRAKSSSVGVKQASFRRA
jgi:hypothetical protein